MAASDYLGIHGNRHTISMTGRGSKVNVILLDHPATLACQADLARGYYATGRLGDAMALLTDIIARGERALPAGDPLTQKMRETLANITG